MRRYWNEEFPLYSELIAHKEQKQQTAQEILDHVKALFTVKEVTH